VHLVPRFGIWYSPARYTFPSGARTSKARTSFSRTRPSNSLPASDSPSEVGAEHRRYRGHERYCCSTTVAAAGKETGAEGRRNFTKRNRAITNFLTREPYATSLMASVDYRHYQDLGTRNIDARHLNVARVHLGKLHSLQEEIRAEALLGTLEREAREAQRVASMKIQQRQAVEARTISRGDLTPSLGCPPDCSPQPHAEPRPSEPRTLRALSDCLARHI
jgi:hypothetical protein